MASLGSLASSFFFQFYVYVQLTWQNDNKLKTFNKQYSIYKKYRPFLVSAQRVGMHAVQILQIWPELIFFLIFIFYYIKVSDIPSGSKSINALTRQWWYHFYPHVCNIIFDQSAHSIIARCQALVVFAVWSFRELKLSSTFRVWCFELTRRVFW